jgi:hypothetical protein
VVGQTMLLQLQLVMEWVRVNDLANAMGLPNQIPVLETT